MTKSGDDEISSTVAWLRRESDLLTNSLHCGDNSITINVSHHRARKFDGAADLLEKLRAECEAIVNAHL
jgi:hypothetical protein